MEQMTSLEPSASIYWSLSEFWRLSFALFRNSFKCLMEQGKGSLPPYKRGQGYWTLYATLYRQSVVLASRIRQRSLSHHLWNHWVLTLLNVQGWFQQQQRHGRDLLICARKLQKPLSRQLSYRRQLINLWMTDWLRKLLRQSPWRLVVLKKNTCSWATGVKIHNYIKSIHWLTAGPLSLKNWLN